MKVLARSIALSALCAVILSGCLDRSDDYDDIDDARRGHVFEKGWLPDLLPASARDLRVTTTVEDSAGRGEFSFDPIDYASFIATLSAYDGAMSKVEKDNRSIKKLLDKGYEAHTYASGATHWIFLCDQKESRCEFFVWQ